MEDIVGAQDVEIIIEHGKLWVRVDSECILRIQRIKCATVQLPETTMKLEF